MSSGGERGVERHSGDPPSPYEVRYGFSRVVRAGPFALVGGTTAVTPDGVVVGDTPYLQAVEILGKIERELTRAGAAREQVVSARAYVTDISRADEVARAYGEAFGEVQPLFTLIGVAALFDPRMLVEIEAMAYLG